MRASHAFSHGPYASRQSNGSARFAVLTFAMNLAVVYLRRAAVSTKYPRGGRGVAQPVINVRAATVQLQVRQRELGPAGDELVGAARIGHEPLEPL